MVCGIDGSNDGVHDDAGDGGNDGAGRGGDDGGNAGNNQTITIRRPPPLVPIVLTPPLRSILTPIQLSSHEQKG